MAIVAAPTTSAFDNLNASSGAVTARDSTSVSIAFSPLASKQSYGLKLIGLFDSQGQATALEQALYTLPDGSSVPIAFPFALTSLGLDLNTPQIRVDRLLEALFADTDSITLGDRADALNAGGGNDVINANGGHDRIRGGAGDDVIHGGEGIDTSIYTGVRAHFQLVATATGFALTDNFGPEGKDQLAAVERLKFADVQLALDLDGAAGTTAKILGAVFGAKSVLNREYVGIGLGLLDAGTSYADLVSLALNVRLGASATNPGAVVDLLYSNVVGSAPSAADRAYFVSLLADGTYTPATLGILACDTDLNLANIDLVGLAKAGLEFV